MEKKIFLSSIITIILFFNLLTAASTIRIQNRNTEPSPLLDAELPIWSIGHFWKYNMDFIFTSKDQGSVKFSVNAEVVNMYATLIEIVNIGDDIVYVLSIDGQISGVVSLFDADIDVAEFNGDFGGFANISTTTLGIKDFIFNLDGQANIPLIGWRDMYFYMLMNFDPCFDFFGFPIIENEEPWDVYIDQTSMYAFVDIDMPLGEHEYSGSMSFSDLINIDRIETVNVPAGSFNSFVLKGTWGYESNLWYAPVVGYLAKVDEKLNWDEGSIIAEFNLELLDTNYVIGNDPPNPPAKPSGPTQGEIEVDYTFTTSTTDPDGDQIFYLFDWGDGTTSGWLGPYNSGAHISANHRWVNKGVYIVIAKAKDTTGIESDWSSPLSILIAGDPKVTIFMHHIEKKDEVDWAIVGTNSPEWYYMCHAKCEGTGSPPQFNYNTDDGTYNGNWISQDIWEPDVNHNFTVDSRLVTIKIKLMDYDDTLEGGSDDLADASGCNYPDCDGVSDGTPDKRGAMYHGTYDLVTEELKPYDPNPDENADFVYKDQGYYFTCGDYEPDSSIEYENGANDPQNDALVSFRLTNDYKLPQAVAQIMDPPNKIRPLEPLQFAGIVYEGIPPYSWNWNFGDGQTSNQQNPVHIYNNKGTYLVKLTVTDGFSQVSSHQIILIVKNDDPILSGDKVTWTGSGSQSDTFTFTVHYIDPDLDIPSVKWVYIDNVVKELNGEGSNAYYNFETKGSDIGKGNHKYYFYFEDGHTGSARTVEKTFKVNNFRSIFREQSKLFLNFIFDHKIFFNIFR